MNTTQILETIKKNRLLLIAAANLVILIAGAFVYINFWPNGTLSSQEAADKAMAFINKNIEQGATATLVWAKEQGSVYQISLKINETPYESYITKDGKFLFPSGIDLETAAATEASAETSVASVSFAQCLTQSGAKFYGTWWCSHCQNQKKGFGDALQYIDYIECEQVPGTSQGSLTDSCKAANIESFPTWIFADGTRNTGEMTLEKLSEKSGCSL